MSLPRTEALATPAGVSLAPLSPTPATLPLSPTPATLPPKRLSMARTLAAFRRIARDYQHTRTRSKTLTGLLGLAIVDNYHRVNKSSRDYPRKKNDHPAGPPTIILATHHQITRARQIKKILQKG